MKIRVLFFFFFQMPPACRSRHQIVGSNCRERKVKREFVVKMDDISPAEEGKLIMWGGGEGSNCLRKASQEKLRVRAAKRQVS